MNLKTAEPQGAISSATTPHGALGTSPFAGLFLREAFNGGASVDDAIELNRIMISSLYLSMIFSENRPTFPDHALGPHLHLDGADGRQVETIVCVFGGKDGFHDASGHHDLAGS